MRYPLRAANWVPLPVMAALAATYLATRLQPPKGPEVALTTMRVVTALLALGCCAGLDDPAAATLAASPTRLWRRRARHAVVTVVPAAVLWLLAFVITGPPGDASAGLALEAAALLALVVTAALVAQRIGVHEPSVVACSVTVAAFLVVIKLPHSIALYSALDDPSWHAAHQRWAALLAGLVVIATGALRDPAARAFHRLAARRTDESYCPQTEPIPPRPATGGQTRTQSGAWPKGSSWLRPTASAAGHDRRWRWSDPRRKRRATTWIRWACTCSSRPTPFASRHGRRIRGRSTMGHHRDERR